MPEYQFDDSGVVDGRTFASLDEFTQGYITALFWTNEAPGVTTREFRTKKYQRAMEAGLTDGTIPGDVGFSDLSPDSLAKIIADCAKFQADNADDLTEACDNGRIDGYDMTRAGHDYWLTRNGHGAGFWDRGLGDVGDKLSEACRHTEVDVYFGDDGKVHVS